MPLSGSELASRTRWYIALRWLLLAAIVLPSLVSLYLGSGLTDQRILSLVMAAVLFGTNGVFHVLVRLRRGVLYYRMLAWTILVFDVLFITYFIYTKGGIESRSQLLYALPILMSAALFGRLAVYLTAFGAAVAYDLVIAGNYFKIIHSPDALTNQAANTTYVLNTIIFFTAVFMVVAVMADFITRLLLEKEAAARDTAAALERAQAIAHIGSWEWHVRDDRLSGSDQLYKVFAIKPGTILKPDLVFFRRVHPDDRQWIQGIFDRALKNHKPFSIDFRLQWPDKSVRVVHCEGKVMVNTRGKPVQLYGTTQDITAERALEAAKGDFVSLASHQLRTPATSVRMILALLKDGYIGKLKPEQQRAAQEAYDANERLLKIADDLLNVAKLESGRLVLNRQEIELGSWLEQLVRSQERHAEEKGLNLRFVPARSRATLYGDPERLAMVIDNLLSNALKYTTKGSITVRLISGRLAHRIKITDTGSGISRRDVSKLFGKFTRLNNSASKGVEGTGLGLYLVKNIIDLHQGSIRVQSKPGSGTTFTIRLPKVSV